MASGSAWPSTRRASGLAYRAACRHARRSTAKPRDTVHAPHGQVGPPPPTGVTWGRARPCAPLCRRPTRLTPSLRSESLPSAAFRRPKRLPSRFSSVASRFSELARLFSAVAGRCLPVLGRCRSLQAPLQQHYGVTDLNRWHDGLKRWYDGLKRWHDGLKRWHDGLNCWYDGLTRWHDGLNRWHDDLTRWHDGLNRRDFAYSDYILS